MKLRYLFVYTTLAIIIASCGSSNTPDTSHIKITTQVQRFDKAFFAIDTLQLENDLNRLQQLYPGFFPDYLVKILGVNPADPQAKEAIKGFLRSYGAVYKAAAAMADKYLPETEAQINKALQLMQYYFPAYKADSPFVITPFIGPMDAFEPFATGDYGDVRTRNGVGIALQLHLGAQAPVYEEGRQAGIFFDYQTRRFIPQMMAVNCIKNIINDAYPYTVAGAPLIEEMIEKGKRLYVLDKLLPDTDDTLKIGYTGKQLKDALTNEAMIWNYFVKNDLLYSKDPSINQSYIKDGPKTTELGDGSPGYLGMFVGHQLVKAFMKKHSQTSLPELMQKPATAIFSETGYKP